MSPSLEFTIPPTPAVVGQTFRGFGTTVGVWTTEPALLPPLVSFLEGWVVAVEAAASRFDVASDISRVNAQPGVAVRVSTILVDAVQAALRMAAETGGLYDPTVGRNVIAAGYDRTFELVETAGPGKDGATRLGGGWTSVDVDEEASTVRVPAGFALDLGGSAKGWAVDRALEVINRSLLPTSPGAGVCVSAGGDLGVTGRPPDGGWPVSIRERLDAASDAAEREVHLVRGAMATSGATQRQWRRDGKLAHHIIDPRTGVPGISTWALVTTFSDSCLTADTMATAAWLLGHQAPANLGRWGVGARLLDDSGTEVLVGDLARWISVEAA